MPALSMRRRVEKRIPMRMFVKICVPDERNYEIAQTVDISRHGARIVTNHSWDVNQNLVLRSLRGSFTSYARVVHCSFIAERSYSLGLQLFNPVGVWPTRIQSQASLPFP
jgi:hypothetical protein